MGDGFVHIDGSDFEGGGQMLRIALSLSCLTAKPINVFNIRAGRKKPGLMEQHLKGTELLRDISAAASSGVAFGSESIRFIPGMIASGDFYSKVKTAGSVSLILQAALPCVLFGPSTSTLVLEGGTNCELAPTIDYTTHVFKRVLENFGATFDCEIIRRGYFPRGGGKVNITVEPVQSLTAIDLVERGEILTIQGWSYVSGNLDVQIAESMADTAAQLLKPYGPVDIHRYKESSSTTTETSSGILLVAETTTGCILSASGLGRQHSKYEDTARNAAKELIRLLESNACVDNYCQDQLIIFMALAEGTSRIRYDELTLHTQTAVQTAEKLTSATFTFDLEDKIIECSGSRYVNRTPLGGPGKQTVFDYGSRYELIRVPNGPNILRKL